MTLLHPNSLTKSLRVGRAFALEEQTELFTLGLTAVKKCAGNYVRSVIFFNH